MTYYPSVLGCILVLVTEDGKEHEIMKAMGILGAAMIAGVVWLSYAAEYYTILWRMRTG